MMSVTINVYFQNSFKTKKAKRTKQNETITTAATTAAAAATTTTKMRLTKHKSKDMQVNLKRRKKQDPQYQYS